MMTAPGTVILGNLTVSRLIIGGNPFSGFSHQGPERDDAMRHYYSATRIKESLAAAEELGITTHIGRADHHVMRILMEYWDEGGKIGWLAQTCSELGPPSNGISNGIRGGAGGAFIHGGQMDHMLAQNGLQDVPGYLQQIRDAGLASGVAGHMPEVFEKAEELNLDVDFYMCCHYNPSDRTKKADHISGHTETFSPAARDRMMGVIKNLSKPVIHYKILAAGRNTPEEAFAYLGEHLRPQDAACIGIYAADKPDMLAEDLELFNKYCAK